MATRSDAHSDKSLARRWARFLLRLGAGGWVGMMIWFSFAVAPTLFATVSADQLGSVLARLFPQYYGYGALFGAAAWIGALWRYGQERGRARGAVLALLTAALLALAQAYRLLRAMSHFAPASAGFSAMHRQSLGLNAIEMLAVFIALVLEAGLD
ncbi:MAG: DUF4149 domain-containing protein [Firmicutes bacterium]|nr:DUF4149 domain-containing protein [Bacillota bacterium]